MFIMKSDSISIRRATLVAIAVAAGLVASADYRPEKKILAARQAFAEQRFGVFIHWGLYSTYAQGEWYLESNKLDETVYSRAMHGFCPSRFDADQWVRAIKGMGAKYVTITSRHHEGFSLWPTKVDDGYNIANTPFKRDILGELAAACRREGVQLNFYYSLLDWHRPFMPPGFRVTLKRDGRRENEDYAAYKRYMMGQLAELCDGYHPGLIWFDGDWGDIKGAEFDWGLDELYDLVHAKGALVASNSHLPVRPKEDIQLFERDLPGENESGFSAENSGSIATDRPIEQCDVIQDNVWGYRIEGRDFRTAENIVAMVARAAAKNSNLLMNIGPDGSGQLPAKALEVMAEVGKWFEKNGESIYATTAGGVALAKDVVSTRKGNVLYLHFLNPAVNKIAFPLKGEITEAKCLACGSKVPVERTASGDAVVTIKRPEGCKIDIVVKLTVGGL